MSQPFGGPTMCAEELTLLINTMADPLQCVVNTILMTPGLSPPARYSQVQTKFLWKKSSGVLWYWRMDWYKLVLGPRGDQK